jgi:hypothetical protein
MELNHSDIRLAYVVRVKYRDRKIRIPPWFLELTELQRNHFYKEIASSKGTEWSYEKEHRLIGNLEDCQTLQIDNRTEYFQFLDHRDIRTVTLGFQCTADAEIQEAVAPHKDFWHVTRCVQEPESFLLRLTT